METLWSDFINSEWHDWKGSGRSEDRLEKLPWQSRFLSDWQLRAPVPAAVGDITAMRQLRKGLHALAVKLAGGEEMAGEDWRLLNQYMEPGRVYREFAPGDGGTVKLEYRPVAAEWEQVMAEVAASFGQTVLQGEAGRIRVCDNPDCRWIFYDDTRNRTKKYCDDKMCGNLMKVRRFRARKKAGQNPDGGAEA
ncbi:zf-CGNR multi-domain protein [Paenibacillus oralis]|uniref:Zf-CGNR multi-domain protein n=1 Tax=Paenibacillus oralis TaxID=2490856 RepID=A0A3P3U829_9BACL|nr:CGNR zinc finger domain-containing protein [Paenibacillus oralis]RRJ66515.1 zf-CGNR multi-domain protein [Paenibacillus oralis]